ncbi:protein TolQ [Neomegalonema perideroedes]|uniref:protein TolQ n=1 Tax=Neomegalonema perideroedes TaxID=217219 RepID=UPI00037062CB|nr:protein TolQ [Neomegalonema perideroedes]
MSEPHLDFSVMALFWQAHWVVKVVVILLLLASFWSWAIIIQKLLGLRSVRVQSANFEKIVWSGQSLDDIYDKVGKAPANPMERIFSTGMNEWRRSFEGGTLVPGSRDRLSLSMDVAIDREVERQEKGLTFLATVGSISPFVGLFGTVWGIKNSFESIAVSQNTNLSVVAPGIAEALGATALGLFAAIPATVGFNYFSGQIGKFSRRIEQFADRFTGLLSTEFDRRGV